MLHCGAHMGVAAPVKQAAVNTPCTVQPPSLPSHPLPRLTRAHGRRARRTTVARRRRRPHPTANAAVRSHSPPPHGYRASNPPSAHTGGSGVPPWHPVPLRATQRRIRVGARGGSCRYEATRRRPAPLSVAAASGWPTRRTPLHLPGFPLPCMAIALGHRTGRGRCPRHGHDRLTPTPLPRHLRHRGPHQWEGPAPPSALVPLPCTSCTLHPPPPSGLAAPTPSSDCRRATPSPVSPCFLKLHTTALPPPRPPPLPLVCPPRHAHHAAAVTSSPPEKELTQQVEDDQHGNHPRPDEEAKQAPRVGARRCFRNLRSGRGGAVVAVAPPKHSNQNDSGSTERQRSRTCAEEATAGGGGVSRASQRQGPRRAGKQGRLAAAAAAAVGDAAPRGRPGVGRASRCRDHARRLATEARNRSSPTGSHPTPAAQAGLSPTSPSSPPRDRSRRGRRAPLAPRR